MSTTQTRNKLNQLDKDLVTLEQKLAAEVKKEGEKTKKINSLQKGITKHTSATTAQSKLRQIQGLQGDLAKVAGNKATLNKKIADKRKSRAETAKKLQKEELADAKKAENAQNEIYTNYEARISELTSQMMPPVISNATPQHLYADSDKEEYDVFISHASEDKKSFADDLCEALNHAGIKVWYDALNIVWGDSLRSKIDAGLRKSRYGIVVLSKDYIQKGWTQYELDGLFQIEMTGGKTILPIWHNITKKEVQDFSPTLSGRLALNTSMMTPQEIADELMKVLGFFEEAEESTNE